MKPTLCTHSADTKYTFHVKLYLERAEALVTTEFADGKWTQPGLNPLPLTAHQLAVRADDPQPASDRSCRPSRTSACLDQVGGPSGAGSYERRDPAIHESAVSAPQTLCCLIAPQVPDRIILSTQVRRST